MYSVSHDDIHTLIVRRRAALDEEERLRRRSRLLAFGGLVSALTFAGAAAAYLCQ